MGIDMILGQLGKWVQLQKLLWSNREVEDGYSNREKKHVRVSEWLQMQETISIN